MSMEERNLKLPEELEKALLKALQDISFHLHDAAGTSHILLDIKHISDAIMQGSQTIIAGAGAGVKIMTKETKARQEFAKSDPQKLADDAIERAISAAKKKGDD